MLNFDVPLIEGFFLNLGLIVGLGPQNNLVMRQGLRRQHLMLMVLICSMIDALLIGFGTAGVGALFQNELLNRLITIAGVVALVVYGIRSFKAAISPVCEDQQSALVPSRTQLVLALMTVSLLNPSLVMEEVLLIGGSATHYHYALRPWFVLGAAGASLVWFLCISYGSALLAPMLKQPRVLRGLEALSGGLLWCMALRLVSQMG